MENEKLNFDIELVRKMSEEQYMSTSEIAKELNTTTRKIRDFCIHHKIEYSAYKYIDPNIIKEEIQNGKSIRSISKKYNYSTKRIAKICKDNNIEYNNNTNTSIITRGITIDKIMEFIELDYSINDVSKYYGCSSTSIYKFCKNNNIKVPRSKYERIDIEEVKKFIEDNKSLSYIARYYNCNSNIIKEFCDENDIIIKKHLVRDRFDINKIKEMISEGWSNPEIAKYYKCNRSTLNSFCNDNNIEWNKKGTGRPGPHLERIRHIEIELKKEIVEKMLNQGDSLIKIAVDHGYMTTFTIKKFCKENNINYVQEKNIITPDFNIEKIEYLIEYGLSFKNIVLYYNCDKKLLKEFCDGNNIIFNKY